MNTKAVLRSVDSLEKQKEFESEQREQLIERLLKSTEERWESDLALSACCCSESRMVN